MFSWPRNVVLASLLLAPLSAGAEAPPDARPSSPAPAEDKVYRLRGQGGRDLFTNAGSVSVGGLPAAAMQLPALEADLATASSSQLQLLDNSVQRAHDESQQGARCQAIRSSLRVPIHTFLLREHLRELAVGVALLVLAGVVSATWRGRLRQLMPLVPLLGSLYLGYATYARVHHRLAALREGLHACSSDLPPQQGGLASVRERLESASSLQATIDRAYAQRAAQADAIMRTR